MTLKCGRRASSEGFANNWYQIHRTLRMHLWISRLQQKEKASEQGVQNASATDSCAITKAIRNGLDLLKERLIKNSASSTIAGNGNVNNWPTFTTMMAKFTSPRNPKVSEQMPRVYAVSFEMWLFRFIASCTRV
ncbi:unnamed protein product [Albugo candida]|uniref:Uncharacterized protein n=1 Tax=Albugo candida TaxID=65357 RepID=A0A024GHS9_9STRA|nr:unnamed protein product [Albugo candida]|eukprot:CCI46276.1 unnamed protein product [Albugo candida]